MKILAHSSTDSNINNFINNPTNGLIIYGAVGSGKDTVRKYISSKLVDKSYLERYKLVMDAKIEGIDEIRSILRELSIKTVGNDQLRRVVIIKNAQHMSHEAQNALLKTVEEPPEDTLIFIQTTEINNILPTIQSRMQRMHIKPISKDQAIKYYDNYDKDLVIKAWMISMGNIGLLYGLLESDFNEPLIKNIEIAKQVLKSSVYERFLLLDKLLKDKEFDPQMLLDGMQRLLFSALEISINNNTDKNIILKNTKRLQKINECKKFLSGNVQPKLVLTGLFYSL